MGFLLRYSVINSIMLCFLAEFALYLQVSFVTKQLYMCVGGSLSKMYYFLIMLVFMFFSFLVLYHISYIKQWLLTEIYLHVRILNMFVIKSSYVEISILSTRHSFFTIKLSVHFK